MKTYSISWQTLVYVGVVSGDLVCGVTDDDGDHGDPAPATACPGSTTSCFSEVIDHTSTSLADQAALY